MTRRTERIAGELLAQLARLLRQGIIHRQSREDLLRLGELAIESPG